MEPPQLAAAPKGHLPQEPPPEPQQCHPWLLVVRARVRVTVIIIVILCQKLCNEVIIVLDHPLLLIVVSMELLNLMHSLSQCMIHNHNEPHLLSQSSSRVIVHLVIHIKFETIHLLDQKVAVLGTLKNNRLLVT
jgi:hypothetical protein